jgi:hypothetical protein
MQGVMDAMFAAEGYQRGNVFVSTRRLETVSDCWMTICKSPVQQREKVGGKADKTRLRPARIGSLVA